MKNFYLFILVLVTHFSFSQNFTDTKGELQISASGSATYTLPIATPPSIKSVAPIINLTYVSGVRGGIAGQGWSINSISTISRMATRRDIDGFVDGVDFDDNDKLALDGQRLLIKTGTYWANGSTYETEYKSNTKIELKIEGTITYFVVTTPDGSRSWFGSKGAGSLKNSISSNSWYIVRYEDVNGNFIDYNYKTITYYGSQQLYIDTIVFSGNTIAGITAQNKISFTYRGSKRIERDYLKGVPVYASQILENIKVYADITIFRTYKLTHIEDKVLGYERINSIQEINGQNEESNPVTFEYAPITANKERTEKEYTNNLAFDKTDLAGDFDGDGRLDFVADNKVFTNLFAENKGNVPIGLPFITKENLYVTATTMTNNRVNQFQSIVNAEPFANGLKFTVYNLNGNAFVNSYSYVVIMGKPTEILGYSYNNSKLIEGDFNGDGISEVVIISTPITEAVSASDPCHNNGTCGNSNSYTNFHLLDLNPNSSVNFGINCYVKLKWSEAFGLDKGVRFVSDFNSDGKSDILVINPDKSYKIFSFKQLTIAPWVQLEIIGSGTLDKYSATKQVLLGDFNGDGKTDIMLPDSEGGEGHIKWHVYYSNGNPSGGEFFTKESFNIVEYRPDTSKESSPYDTQVHISSYYAIDINGDGKADLVRVWRKYYKPKWTINDHNTQWQVTAFANTIDKAVASGFVQTYDSGVFTSGSPEIPIPIPSNYKYKGANTDLVLVRGHKNIVEYYQFNKNVDAENRLIKVTESSGNIRQSIEYKKMEAADGKLGNAETDFYSSANSVTYPNIEIQKNAACYLVSKLTATINGISKYQDFRYRGFVSNFNYGTVGFTKTTRSSWYLNDSDPKLWTTQNNDIALRGANTITWLHTLGLTSFVNVPTLLLSTKTNEFSVYTKGGAPAFNGGVYNVLLNKQTTIDHSTNVKTETSFTYDGTVQSADYFGLETKSITRQYSGSALQGTTTVDTQYDNNIAGAGANYFVGRPKKVNTSTVIYTGDIRTAEETYTYTGSNLTKTEKKGNNTYAIVEDITYDSLGNVLTKKISAPAAPIPVAPRTITDEYDSTKRFVVKKKDHQNFETVFAYNNLGQVIKSTDYLGVISVYRYDNWGKLIYSLSQYAAATPLTTTIEYAKLANGGYTTTTTNNTDAKTITQYDVLGRAVTTTTKGFAEGTTVSKQVVYDALGRKTKESEPYFISPAGLWTVYEYDHLMRPKTIKAPTGKITTFEYSGLTTTSNDDGKITTATINALGNKTQTTDPGGTVNFIYYANGQLKESDYQGNKVSISIDGWGNKIAMTDPSAGTYSYSYDAFGQIKTETTPNGTTAYVYDNAGKTIEKTIKDNYTDSKTTYTYNPATNLIVKSSFANNKEGTLITNSFEYDAYKRISKTIESTPYAVFTKELAYDMYGRTLSETSTATISGKTSSKKVRHTYQNGLAWQIVDESSQKVLWQTNSLNERGQLTSASLGNGINNTNSYNIYGYASQFKWDRTVANPGNVITLTTLFEPKRGNLTNRTNNAFGWNESFSYDGLDRLLTYKNGLAQQETQSYDVKGKIIQNNLGTYNYPATGKTYQNNSITLTPQALSYYQNRGAGTNTATKLGLDIAYNTFKSPVTIKERGRDGNYIDYLSFNYNDGNDRSTMFYGGSQENKLLRPLRKHYSGDGTMEIKENRTTGAIEFVTYIGGDGYSAPLVLKSDGTTQNYLYLHRDYQGTILAITDNVGTIVEKRLFDAWGALLRVQNGAGVALTGLTVLDRGYTGHEHLQSIGLINMNGRLYDPKLHRFLQPDNFIQDPANTQNYNRYGYVLNNPLKYTDPSGEFAEIGFLAAVGIGATIAALTYTITALVADVPFNVGGLVKATFIGAASSAVTFGIGSAAGNLFTNFYSQAAFSAAAHGTFQGGMTAISGGKFWSGFAAGALSSVAASAWSGGGSTSSYHGAGSFASSGVGMITFGTVAGGTGAALTGGNFWQGAATGLVVSGLNHFMHNIIGNSKLTKKFEKDIRTLKGRPMPGQESVDTIMGLDTFKTVASNSGNPDVNYVYTTSGLSEGGTGTIGDTALYSTPANVRGENYTGSKGGFINVYSDAFSSWRSLGSSIIHELGHAYSRHSGGFAIRYDKMGKSWSNAIAIDEVYAYSFARQFGVSFYQPGSNLFTSGLQRALNILDIK